jgi:HKD family nuclease
MDVELLSAVTVSRRLRTLIDKHDEIHLAVAWGYNGPLAEHLLENKSKFASVTFGLAFCQTDPALIESLVGVQNAYVAQGGKATFHPKIYYFRSGNEAEAIVGSSNFTAGGLSKNWEACLHVKGRAKDTVFDQIRAVLKDYESLRKEVTRELAASYRIQFEAAQKLRKPKDPVLPGDGLPWTQVASPLAQMTWPTYIHAVKSSKYHALDKRLILLRTCQHLFARVRSFAALSEDEWKAIAGVIGERQKQESGLDSLDWGWFGSMKGMGDFANRIREHDAWLARAVDSIPRHGEVSREQYDAFCEHFLKAFEHSSRTGGVPTATRLLAMKRPDTFVCVSKPNTAGLSKALGFPRTTLGLENYWERVIEPIRLSPWYNAARPSGPDAEIWDGRAAMLDAIYYAP